MSIIVNKDHKHLITVLFKLNALGLIDIKRFLKRHCSPIFPIPIDTVANPVYSLVVHSVPILELLHDSLSRTS